MERPHNGLLQFVWAVLAAWYGFSMSPISVTPGDTPAVLPAPSVSDKLSAREELVQFRSGPWRMLLPMRFVERVLGAALPSVSPAANGAPPVVALGEALVPVLFAEALLGAEEVHLAAQDQMILLGHGGRRALLWVGAVEEVVEFDPVSPPAGPQRPLVVAFSGAARPLAVLDVPGLLKLAA